MKDIKWIVAALIITLFAVTGYMPAALQHDFADPENTGDRTEPESMERYSPPSGYTLTQDDSGGMKIRMQLPDCFGAYLEVFGRTNLLSGQWNVVDSWIPTYGSAELIWNDIARTNVNTFFYMIHDATIDNDGDGYSDWREHYISLTDPEVFDYMDDDGDGMHDFWEAKLFGNIWTQDGNDDSDGDGLSNNEELVWLSANMIRMHSDPSLYDTDGEGLDDLTERRMQTDPLSKDTDFDGRDDAFEILGSPPTDPNNPDTIAPVLVLAGG